MTLNNDDVTNVTGVTGSVSKGSKGVVSCTPAVTSVSEAISKATEADEEYECISPVPQEERPCYRVYDTWQELEGGGKYKPGVYWHAAIEKEGQISFIDTWICGPLYIDAQSSDKYGNNFGRLLRFKNTNGRWRVWAMPMELLRGSGDELRGALLSMGLAIDPLHGKKLLLQYLQAIAPYKKILCALQTGWCKNSFVLPDQVIGPDAEDIIYQSGECPPDEHGQAGSLDEWRNEIGSKAINNPMLALGLSVAFAGPILERCNIEGGGFHLVEDSSSGKTSILDAACSVWGGSSYRRSWRTTANGIEGAAALFNDCLLAMDEISECDPKDVGKIVYSLANGYGKQRASKTGAARPLARWKCVILSNGERTIETSMAAGGERAKAGQSVRLLDIPARRKYGCWDDLHGFNNGAAFSDAIKEKAKSHYGRAGRAFLEQLTHDQRDWSAEFEKFKKLPEFISVGAEGQEKRAATRFALAALAGEIAIEYGITGWPQGEAIKAAVIGFEAWKSLRGNGNDERRTILRQVSEFIQRYGDSRFSDIEWPDASPLIRDRAGYWRKESDDKRTYLFNASGMRDALVGFDFKRALDVLEECGVVPAANSKGERAKPVKIKGKSVVRLYEVMPDALEK